MNDPEEVLKIDLYNGKIFAFRVSKDFTIAYCRKKKTLVNKNGSCEYYER